MKSNTESGEEVRAAPPVGSTALGPRTKLPSVTGVCGPSRISPALRMWPRWANGSLGQDLQMLGRIVIDEVDRRVEIAGQHDAAVRAAQHGLGEARPAARPISAQCPAARRGAASATARLWVTRKAEESGPCSASMMRSSAASAPVGRLIGEDDAFAGPAGMPGSMTSASRRLAATTQGLPGPTILSAARHRLVP